MTDNFNGVEQMSAMPTKKSKKGLIIGLSVGAAVIAIAVVVVLLMLGKKTKIDLNKYIIVETEGYDGLGEIVSYKLDKAQMLKDIMKDKGVKNTKNLKRYEVPDEIFNLVNDMEISIVVDESEDESEEGSADNGNTGFKNGDVVEFTIKYSTSKAKDAKLEFKNKNATYQINDLEPLQEIDIFEGIEVTFSGFEGDATVYINKVKYDDIYYDVYFNCDYDSDLKNGDKVTVTAKAKRGDETGSYYGYKFTSTSKEYTVEGLEKYPEGLSDITNSILEELKEIAENQIDNSYDYEYDGTLSQVEYVGAYFVKQRKVYNNYMYLIYKGTVTSTNGEFEPFEIFLPVKLGSIKINGEGELGDDYISADLYGSFWVDNTWCSFDGYADPFDMYENIIGSDDVEVSSGMPDYSKRPVIQEPVVDETPEEGTVEDGAAEGEDAA